MKKIEQTDTTSKNDRKLKLNLNFNNSKRYRQKIKIKAFSMFSNVMYLSKQFIKNRYKNKHK